MSARPRIGVAFPGGIRDPQSWSGIPHRLAGGLAAAGAEVVELDVEAPARLERALAAGLGVGHALRRRDGGAEAALRRGFSTGLLSPSVARLRTAVGAARVRAAGPLNGIVQISTAFLLPPAAPVVTFEDMTIAQALEYPYAHWSTLGRGSIDARFALQRAVYGRAAAVALSNSWAARSVVEDYGLAPGKVHVVGMGTDQEPRDAARHWTAPRFLFVGREWERKNGPAVVAAFAAVRERWPDARLDVVGGHPPLDGPGVHGHGLLRLDVPDHQETLRELYDRATCFVMPSLFEPSAIVYAEALAAGIPSIGTAVGGSADIIGDAGIVVDPNSPDAIRDAMLALADPAAAAACGARARARAPQFTWKAVAGRLLDALRASTEAAPLAA